MITRQSYNHIYGCKDKEDNTSRREGICPALLFCVPLLLLLVSWMLVSFQEGEGDRKRDRDREEQASWDIGPYVSVSVLPPRVPWGNVGNLIGLCDTAGSTLSWAVLIHVWRQRDFAVGHWSSAKAREGDNSFSFSSHSCGFCLNSPPVTHLLLCQRPHPGLCRLSLFPGAFPSFLALRTVCGWKEGEMDHRLPRIHPWWHRCRLQRHRIVEYGELQFVGYLAKQSWESLVLVALWLDRRGLYASILLLFCKRECKTCLLPHPIIQGVFHYHLGLPLSCFPAFKISAKNGLDGNVSPL